MDYRSENGTDRVENRRAKVRVPCKGDIYCKRYIQDDNNVELSTPLYMEIENITTEGIGVVSDEKLEENSILTISVVLEDIEYENITAKVIWNMRKGSRYSMGLKIINMSGRLFSQIKKLENNLIVEI